MISFTLPFLPSEELRQQGFNAFLFDFPQGMLKSSATGALTESFSATEMVTGLASREVRLPSWAEKIVSAFVSGDTSALFKLLPMVPLILLFAPLFIRSVASKVQKAYNAYGISLNDLVKDASKAIRKLIPTLLSQREIFKDLPEMADDIATKLFTVDGKPSMDFIMYIINSFTSHTTVKDLSNFATTVLDAF